MRLFLNRSVSKSASRYALTKTPKRRYGKSANSYSSTIVLPKTDYKLWPKHDSIRDKFMAKCVDECYKWQVRFWIGSFGLPLTSSRNIYPVNRSSFMMALLMQMANCTWVRLSLHPANNRPRSQQNSKGYNSTVSCPSRSKGIVHSRMGLPWSSHRIESSQKGYQKGYSSNYNPANRANVCGENCPTTNGWIQGMGNSW